MLEELRRLWEHAFWADLKVLEALRAAEAVPEAVREFSHVIGVEELWLARLQRRPSQAAVWPEVSLLEAEKLLEQTRSAYQGYLAALQASDLKQRIEYTNSAGQKFSNTVGDILLHAALHGQYHRGKVNLMLRQAGHAAAPTDFIAFVRGAPAATEASSRPSERRGAD